MSYKDAVSAFNKLSYEDKKKKVFAMLNILKEEWNIFQDLWDLMSVSENVSESIVDMIYQVITKAMYSLKEKEMETAIDKLEQVKDKMNNIKGQEEKENEDADAILEKMI